MLQGESIVLQINKLSLFFSFCTHPVTEMVFLIQNRRSLHILRLLQNKSLILLSTENTVSYTYKYIIYIHI